MRRLNRAGVLALVLTALVLTAPALVIGPLASPAAAAARVGVANPDGAPVIDAKYATTLTLSGAGFQSIRNGHGGIYVLFGTVSGTWRPSANGNGSHLTVPDTESKNNSGYARFVAFPGSDTAGSANGGTLSANGSWSTKIAVPGAVFTTYDGTGKAITVDCRKVTCGVLTIGAHGVANARNETFTPVRVANLYPSGTTTATAGPTTTATPSTADTASPGSARPALAAPAGPPTLEVDRASAQPGRVLAFTGSGLTPGSQVSATFEDGQAGVGPLTVGSSGQVAGLLRLPGDLASGTYQLRLVGDGDQPSVRFAVVAPTGTAVEGRDRAPILFASLGGLAVLAALGFAGLRRRRAA